MKGWHFCRDDKKLGFNDNRHIRTGRTLKVEPPIKLCEKGLHASERIMDALKYSQGNILCRVELSGQIIKDTDKLVATERTVLSMFNASKILHEFACQCAERALKKAKVKDKRSWKAIRVKRLWLIGKATNKELAAATAAARSANAAAWSAAAAAARSATTAAWSAATAAWSAANAAAIVAEKKWQNRLLTKMVKDK